MAPVRTFAKRLAVDCFIWAAQFAALYAWEVRGINGAGNLLIFWISFLSLLGFIRALATPTEPLPRRVLPRLLSRCLNGIFLASLIWYGHGWLATGYAFAWICSLVHLARFNADGSVKA